ncbi:hypothetical protein PILCRDRAFT_491036 [Piloderma croceum F 1598]|uniref:Uncharacterized protein n=1 Tax=Piloderma croceum (strain F 1598) TaxID=765440 RepID=A0A0C3BWR7_PILCF|nr:hypothetical protein PILCRDRAFT_491036 [Piloderma croceum F 1598]
MADGFRQAIIKSSFTEHLVDKLVEGGAPIVSIMKALELFAESEDIRATMIESRIVCVLVTGFAERSLWGTVITVRAIQTSLMKYDDFRQALLQQKLISALVRLVKSGNIFIVLSTAHILVDLGSHVDTRNAVLASDLVKSLVDRLRPWKSFREQISNMELDGDLHDAVKKEYENPKSDDVPGWFYAVVVLNCLGILCFHLVSVVWMMRYG